MVTKYIVNNLTGQTITGDLTINGNIIVTGTSNNFGIYRALLTQTGSITGRTASDFNYGLIIGERYTITDYKEGDDFSNIADVQYGNGNTTGCVFIATGQTPAYWENNSELVSSGEFIVDVLENTLGYDLYWYWAPFDGYGYYVAVNGTTGPVYNSFNRDKVEIITPFKYPFSNGGPSFPPFIVPGISSFMTKDDIIFIDAIYVGGGPGDIENDLLYYTPIEIKINQDTDTTPIVIYGEVIDSFPFSYTSISLICNGNNIQDVYCNNTSTVNNMSELIILLNNDINNVYGFIYSEGGPGGIMTTIPTNLKNQFCDNGTLILEIFSNT